ncbi:hypothetical protein JCM19237_3462 [Photobacterium aphoticum]|uniref:Uncharacterized protein n=1 Tax=Photobacterium aphoticum TaxID=754436 RepID=A0A090QTC3_9GAMM|nr:hypothetical protein JCM19237_3462 [Photobacterium aphoticum]
MAIYLPELDPVNTDFPAPETALAEPMACWHLGVTYAQPA